MVRFFCAPYKELNYREAGLRLKNSKLQTGNQNSLSLPLTPVVKQ
jgi:hypothetical protein